MASRLKLKRSGDLTGRSDRPKHLAVVSPNNIARCPVIEWPPRHDAVGRPNAGALVNEVLIGVHTCVERAAGAVFSRECADANDTLLAVERLQGRAPGVTETLLLASKADQGQL